MSANLQKALAATLTLLLIATVVVALTLSGDNGHPRRIEAGGPPTETPTLTNTPTPTTTPTKAPEFNAVAKVITDAQDLIEGPLSRGRLGDYLLANSEIQVVIQDIQRNIFSVGQFGGQILDADLVRVPSDPERDNFEEWAVGINLENTGHYAKVNIINDGSNGQPAVIRATGVDDLLDFINPSSQVAGFGLTFPSTFDDADLAVEVTTDYILAPNDNFVQVDTTFKNTSGTLIETFITDFLSGSGEVEHFVPGYGFGEPLATSSCALCNFVAWSGYGQADGVSYGYIHDIPDSTVFSTSGVTIPALGVSAALALIGVEDTTPIDPNGGEVTVTRYFAVGDGDVGSIVDIRNTILGLATGTITGTITRAGQPVEGADVVVLGDQADGPSELTTNVVSHYRTDANGQYEGTLPPGDYTLQAHLDGHLAASPDPANVTVIDSSTTTQDFTIPEAGRVRVTIVDESNAAIAGKVSLVGFDQYPDPENTGTLLGFVQIRTALFGEVSKDRLPFGLAKVVFVDNLGDSGEFFIEPGSYRVVVSHGTEYSLFEENIVVTAGALTMVTAEIAKVIDTTGFVSGDFHIHQLNSPDSAVTFDQRVVSALAEGLEFFTPSDHQFRSDLTPAIASLGVGSLVSVAPNSENTTPDYGHFNAWPMTIDSSQVNGGALDWGSEGVPPVPPPAGQDFPSFGNYMMPPADIFANLLLDPGTSNTVQINHMDSFFGPGGLAIDTSFIPPQDFADNLSKRLDPSIPNLFDDSFTALEVWQGTGLGDIDSFINRNLGDWFNMMNQGIIRTGYAVSDTHKRVTDQSGFPRAMLASPTDDAGALGAIAGTLSANVNDGRAISTNAPFVRVTTEATSTGETGGLALGLPTLISTTDGSATITVNIQSPLWAEFDRVEYYINHVPFPDDFDGDPATPPFWRVTPDVVQTAGVDFTVNTIDDFPSITGAKHLEATTSLTLNGLTDDTWVVVLVRGTDGVSKPIFPVVPNDLDQTLNPTQADLIDGNLGEDGIPATAFTNPVFIDIDGNAAYDPRPVDSDRDGCTNDREMDPKSQAASGGGRSPSSHWDFFDTWTIQADGSLAKDHRVDGFDIGVVVARFGAVRGTPPTKGEALAEALTPPVDSTSYHSAFDRDSPDPEANVWNLRPPNGFIDAFDIAFVVFQFGHSCVVLPLP